MGTCVGSAVGKRDIVEEALKEKRRFRRIRLNRSGKVYFPDTAEEAECRLENISVGGALVRCKFLRQPGGRAIVYLGELGQFEGRITALEKDAFSMTFTCSRQKQGKLADQLTVEINRHLLDGSALS